MLPQTLPHIAMPISNQKQLESPNSELPSSRYRSLIPKENAEKRAEQGDIIVSGLLHERRGQTLTISKWPSRTWDLVCNCREKSPLLRERRERFDADQIRLLRSTSNGCISWFSKLEISRTGFSGFARDPVRANEICYPTKFNILDSKVKLKFPTEVVSTKDRSHTSGVVLSQIPLESLEWDWKPHEMHERSF